jgi:hypothetical protein
VTQRELDDGTCHLYVNGPLVCFNLFHMIRELEVPPQGARTVHVHLSSRVPLVDNTTCDFLYTLQEEFRISDQGPDLVIEGWDRMRPLSSHEASRRVALGAVENLAISARAEQEVHAAQRPG